MIDKKLICFLLFLTSIALCAGSFFEVSMEGIGKNQLMDLLTNQVTEQNTSSFITSMFNSFVPNIKLYCFLFLCPILPFLSILCPCICIFKGLSIGFSSTMLIEIFGAKGVIYILTTIMPHNIIQLPLICILSSLSMKASLTVANFYLYRGKRSRNKNALQNSVRHYLTIYVFALIFTFISCLIQVCLKQFLL